MEEVQVNITEDKVVGTTVSPQRSQGNLDEYMVKKSKAYHFVSTCNWDYPNFKGITHKIDTKMPYLFVKEIGKNGGAEHHHLYFYSPKSLNTVKKYLLECNFINLKHSNPCNPKYDKFNNHRGYKDLAGYENLGCIIYLLKGKTNHLTCKDDLKIFPEISIDNIEDITSARDLYEEVIKEMREKRDILIQEKVDNKEKKSEIELFRFFEYIENCSCHHDLPDYIGSFFLANSDIVHSEHKGFSFYKAALKKLYPQVYKEFCTNCVLKKLKQLTEC